MGANGMYDFDSQGELMEKPLYIKVFRDGKSETIMSSRNYSNFISSSTPTIQDD
jgi:hypothetical protein